jgi:hypothetical protein
MRTKWWNLKEDASQIFKDKLITERTWNISEDADSMWKEMVIRIRKVAIYVFGVTRENKRELKDTLWWNEDVQKMINEKKKYYKCLHHYKSNDVYMMTKIRDRKTRDFNQIKYIKDESDRFLMKDEEIKNKRREYSDKLFNKESEKIVIELDDSFDDSNRRFVRKIH